MTVPKLRFPGFTDDWKTNKLSELLKQRTEHQKISDEAPLLAFSYAEGVINPEDKKSNKRDFIMTDKYNKIFSKTEKDDIIYNPANVIHGAIHRNKLGTGVVSPIYKIFICQDVSPKFIGERLHTDGFINEMARYIEGTVVKLRTLSPVQFLQMSINYPSLIEEQEKIGNFLECIDNLLNLHRCKCEELQELKKSMLQKIFPKEGEKAPEIRFPGFTGDWEQRKFGDVFVEYSEKNHEELPALMIIQGGGTIRRDESDRSLLYDKANLSNYKMVKEGDFIVHLRSFEGGLEKATNTGIISPAYHTFHGENTDSRFYYSYFRSKKFIDIDLKPHVYGIRDGRSIDIEGMKTIKIPSTSYEEQKAIGTFIEHLDNLITLHHHKYDELKELKKGLLQQLFC